MERRRSRRFESVSFAHVDGVPTKEINSVDESGEGIKVAVAKPSTAEARNRDATWDMTWDMKTVYTVR